MERRFPVRALAWMAIAFAVAIVATHLLPRDPLAKLRPLVATPKGAFSVIAPVSFLSTTGEVIPRKPNEVRAFFVGASETAALPYEPTGMASYAAQLGAGLQAALGRSDVHVRAEGTTALEGLQILSQARIILKYAAPSLIVLVLGGNEFLGRIAHGTFLLPETPIERTMIAAGRGRSLLDEAERYARTRPELAKWLRSEASRGSAASFVALMRNAEPGRPATRGVPIGERDRMLLLERLQREITAFAEECKEKDCTLAIALAMHGMDGAPPWCSELEPGPPQIHTFLEQVFAAPSGDQLPQVDRWLAQHPRRADLVYARAKILHAMGRPEARDEFLRALDLDYVPLHQTREVRAALRKTATELGLAFFDLNEAFQDATGVTGPDRFLDYAHVDLEGHRQLARHLAKKLSGNLLPKLPEGYEAKFELGMKAWSDTMVSKPSIPLAQGRMSLNLSRYYMAFGNFRDALPHAKRAASDLADEGTGPADDLAFCRKKLREAAIGASR